MSTTTKKINKNGRNRRRRRNKTVQKRIQSGRFPPVPNLPSISTAVHMSKCAISYGKALINPFGAFSELPCLPDAVTVPSYRHMAKVRGVFSTGTLGVGWVAFNPWMAVASDFSAGATWSDFPVVSTNPNFAGTSYNWAVAASLFTTGVEGSNSNSRFSFNDFQLAQNNWQYRLVAAGLSVRYVGSTFRNQGRVILYRDQHSDNIPRAAGSTSSYFLGDNYSVAVPVSRNVHYITAPPTEYDLLGYLALNQFADGTSALNRYCMLIYVDGGDVSVPQTFEFEAIAFYEIVGKNLPLQHSSSDPVGKAAFDSTMPNKCPTVSPQIAERTIFKNVGKVLMETSSLILPYVGNVAKKLVQSNFPLLQPAISSLTTGADDVD